MHENSVYSFATVLIVVLVCLSLDLISLFAQPCVLHLAELLLYSSAYVVVRIFHRLRVVEVGFNEAVLLIQQLIDRIAVLIKSVLCLLVEGPRIFEAVL